MTKKTSEKVRREREAQELRALVIRLQQDPEAMKQARQIARAV